MGNAESRASGGDVLSYWKLFRIPHSAFAYCPISNNSSSLVI